MIIRWLGAFRKTSGLYDSLVYECFQNQRKHVAAEQLQHGVSEIKHARVGLLVKNSAVVHRYWSDVWSEYNDNGTLKKTRQQGKAWSTHREAFCRPEYLGVVLKDHKEITNTALQAVKRFCDQYDVPCFLLDKSTRRLVQIKLT